MCCTMMLCDVECELTHWSTHRIVSRWLTTYGMQNDVVWCRLWVDYFVEANWTVSRATNIVQWHCVIQRVSYWLSEADRLVRWWLTASGLQNNVVRCSLWVDWLGEGNIMVSNGDWIANDVVQCSKWVDWLVDVSWSPDSDVLECEYAKILVVTWF